MDLHNLIVFLEMLPFVMWIKKTASACVNSVGRGEELTR